MPATAVGLALRASLLLCSVLIFLATGEIALRAVYRDAGKRTLGAPGFHVFEHVNAHDQQRGRLDFGAKRAGLPRLLVVGDSITWGTGVREWQDTWPEQLARMYEQAEQARELAVLSLPGREIDAHVEQVKIWANDIRPDIFIYQWYVNDVEILHRRPSTERSWQQQGWHDWLRRASYLYYFLDNRVSQLLPPVERSYVDYILQDFIPSSLEWSEFERYFHELATRAREMSPQRLLLLYPQVPFSGEYPLRSVHQRLAALARAERISIPPAAWVRTSGDIVDRPDGKWKQAVRVPSSAPPRSIITRPYYARGEVTLIATFAAPDSPSGTAVGTLEAVDPETGVTMAAAPLVSRKAGDALQEVSVQLQLQDDKGRGVQLAFGTAGGGDVLLASVDLRVNYGFDVLDLTETMNGFDTHVSIFDAHPNPAAHRVVAEQVFTKLAALERENAR